MEELSDVVMEAMANVLEIVNSPCNHISIHLWNNRKFLNLEKLQKAIEYRFSPRRFHRTSSSLQSSSSLRFSSRRIIRRCSTGFGQGEPEAGESWRNETKEREDCCLSRSNQFEPFADVSKTWGGHRIQSSCRSCSQGYRQVEVGRVSGQWFNLCLFVVFFFLIFFFNSCVLLFIILLNFINYYVE